MVVFYTFASYRIKEYHFNVNGKTKEQSLLEAIGNAGNVFETVDELQSFLDGKQQMLYNKRLFESVEYDYTILEGYGVFSLG